MKEAIASGITKLVGAAITNPIFRTSDGTDFRTVNKYSLAELLKAVSGGTERPEAANIRRKFVSLAATQFDFRERIATNVEQFATLTSKSKLYGIKVHNDAKAAVLLTNVKWAAQ